MSAVTIAVIVLGAACSVSNAPPADSAAVAAVETEAPTATAVPLAAPTPVPTVADVPDTPGSLVALAELGFAEDDHSEIAACIGDDARPLLTSALAALSTDQEVTLTEATFTCRPAGLGGLVAEELEPLIGDQWTAEIAACSTSWFQENERDRGAMLRSMAMFRRGALPEPGATDEVVDLYATCIPGEALVETFAVATAAGYDDTCLSELFDDLEVRRAMLAATVNATQAFDVFELLEQCSSAVSLIEARYEARGVVLSASTVECLELELFDLDVSWLLQNDDAALDVLVMPCLNDDERRALST